MKIEITTDCGVKFIRTDIGINGLDIALLNMKQAIRKHYSIHENCSKYSEPDTNERTIYRCPNCNKIPVQTHKYIEGHKDKFCTCNA